MPSICLTPDFVDLQVSPEKGEVWFRDNHVRHFGLRLWAGKNGGGRAYAIRFRNRSGKLVRETFRPDRDCDVYAWVNGWEKPLGYFLEHARRWAWQRVSEHFGQHDYEQHKRLRRKNRILASTLGGAINRKLIKIRRQSGNHIYIDNIQNLIGKYIPDQVMRSTFRDVDIRVLADAVSGRDISYGNVKILRAFVSGVLREASSIFGPLGHKLDSFQRRCARNLDARTAPPYPQILNISPADYQRFFEILAQDSNWRQSLAIHLYFATGARLQSVLRARWSDFIDGIWYPFLPEERKLWFESKERLDNQALAVLSDIQRRHRVEGLSSIYLFPSLIDVSRPIRTIQRHWARHSGTMGWRDLPMSHVVLRHRERSNPSYYLFFHRCYLQFDRDEGEMAVSKIANRRNFHSINSNDYMVEHKPSENLIA